MDGLSILAGLTAFNNRATEAFKMVLRDKTPMDDEWRRFFTLLFSIAIGIASVAGLVFGTDVSFDGTWLAPFTDNPLFISVLGGFSVSVVSGVVQPLIDRLQERPTTAQNSPARIIEVHDGGAINEHAA